MRIPGFYCLPLFDDRAMNPKRAPHSSESNLYRDYRRDVNILDLSWVLECREVRLRRRARRRRRVLRLLWILGIAVAWWLLKR